MIGKTRLFHSLTAFALSAALLLPNLGIRAQAAAENRELFMQQSVTMALQASSELTAQKNKILLKQMKYVEAVKGIRAKIKNLRTFRWTPLLSFKFPQPLNITNEYDMNVKPSVLQTDIDKLNHQVADIRRSVVEKTETQYITVYQLQTSVAFTQANLDDARAQMDRTQAQLASGMSIKTDADRAKARVETLETKMSNLMRDFETAKTKLSELIHVDVTTGYTFLNPFRVASIPRENLDQLIQNTLDNDQQFYEAKVAESVALITVNAYESLMRNQYGGKINGIQNFISMTKQGMEVDSAAFQLAYNDMLGRLDRPWDGYFRIIFFKFSKEFFKGAISGTRYIEDEMYAVYTACMEYSAARKERESLEKELTGQVKDMFENMVTSYNAYEGLQVSADRNKQELERTQQLNRAGKATFTEVADAQEGYQSSQQDALDSLYEYNKLICQFDRLTCGAVSNYLSGTGMELDTGSGGNAFEGDKEGGSGEEDGSLPPKDAKDPYAMLDPIADPYYYIYNSVADLSFNIGVSIPEGFEPAVDGFEIWYEGTQIGKRTPLGQELRHLVLDYGETNLLNIRLFNGDKYVDECVINTSVPRDVLDIQSSRPPAKQPKILGSYKLRSVMEEKLSLTELTLLPNASQQVTEYSLTYGESTILTHGNIPIADSFSYLTLMVPSLNEVEITLYKKDGSELTAYFDTENLQIVDMKPTPEPEE